MGDVYRATDSVLNRTVAVKVLSERHAREPAARARFEREALAAARLSGIRHVITVFDVGEHEGRPFIVMEYLDGGSLHDRLQEGGIEREQALEWLEQAAYALDQAHARGVVHRDVKPANLLLDGDGAVHVSDFGIASAAGFDTLTLPGTVLGTAGYLSPEQASGEPATDASDRYALGALAFELLTGRRPFAAESSTTEAFAHVTPVPSAAALDPRLPAQVDWVFARALAKDPAERPETATELVSDLRGALREEPLSAASSGTASTTIHRTRRRRLVPVLLGVAALLAAALALAGALGVAGGRDENPPSSAPATPEEVAANGADLNNRGFARMEEGDYERALPLLVRAVDVLRGSGTLTEAYARYNLAFTRFALGHCTGVLTPLDRSEAIQGQRDEIDALRGEWNERCAPPPADEDEGPGNGKGKGKGRGGDKGDE
jgi:eukaryotic-like serine/threonine-protein kinase